MGLFVGACLGWLLYIRQRRKNVQIDEEKQLVHQEKQIVVEFMHNLVEAIGAGVGREELFQHIVHASILSTGAMSACIFERTGKNTLKGIAVEGLFPPQHQLPEKSRDKLSTRSKFIEQILKSEVFEMGEGLIGSVARTGKAVLIEDARNDPRVIQHDDPALKVRSLVVAPLAFRSKILGVLAVANPADGIAFNEADFSLVQSLAEQAAMAIHNSDLMEMQIEKSKLDLDIAVASSIQGMILPQKFPDNSALDIDAFYRPAQKIGGDLYNVIRLDDDRVGLAIADVSGKGVPASLLMTICQTNLRHFAQSYRSPSEVLKAMNREMSEEIRRDMFITIIYAIIDTTQQTLTLARAGHELPLLCVHGGEDIKPELTFVGSEGMGLGMVPAEIFDFVIEDKTVPFQHGDIAVFYTDGVTEAADEEGTEFGSARLAECVRTLRNRSSRDLNTGIVSTVERYTGQAKFADDLTLITVKHT
ncbi:GAF domain-containing SpoIIE family protein phosphatase [Ruficoccus sp. ZRK36]|uniref:PP2C family protein-serine/threonine phosphatase n=1 Tax=Ruficoccus sp. ZRK36 TaxID=2866311 RepID=UPI001C731EDB|nr:GAF domain-containing SpoIIE family protein phosphatase [Ruficoccus sp. ZRK36]QYY36347.1 SpoIIE family protein phosphatase [Ruficoccus sp. ZRK36]